MMMMPEKKSSKCLIAGRRKSRQRWIQSHLSGEKINKRRQKVWEWLQKEHVNKNIRLLSQRWWKQWAWRSEQTNNQTTFRKVRLFLFLILYSAQLAAYTAHDSKRRYTRTQKPMRLGYHTTYIHTVLSCTTHTRMFALHLHLPGFTAILKLNVSLLVRSFINPEDGGDMFLQNVG
jgi:hypothetical protein